MIKIKISSLWIHLPQEGQQLHRPVFSAAGPQRCVTLDAGPSWLPELGHWKPSPKGPHSELVPAPTSLEAKYWLVG